MDPGKRSIPVVAGGVLGSSQESRVTSQETRDSRLATRLRIPIQTSRQAGVLRHVRVVGFPEGDWQVDVDPVGLSAPVVAAGREDRLPTSVVGLTKEPAH